MLLALKGELSLPFGLLAHLSRGSCLSVSDIVSYVS